MSSGILRLLMVAAKRYARDPDTRRNSSRLVMSAAIALYAEETSVAEAAIAAAEAVAERAQSERQRLNEVAR